MFYGKIEKNFKMFSQLVQIMGNMTRERRKDNVTA